MEPIRVLHVVTYMGRGGLETMLMNYYRRMDREQVQFDFLTHRDFRGDYDDEIEALGGRIYRLPRLIPWSGSYLRTLDAFFRDHPEYRIVHVHQDCLSGVILKAARNRGIPVRIAHSHSSSQVKDLKYPIKLLYMGMIPRYATALFACGKAAGDWMFSGAPYRVLPNAVETRRFAHCRSTAQKVRRELGLEEGFVIGHVGQFRREKNQQFLLDVFAAVLRKRPDARLIMAGAGTYLDDCRAKAARLGLGEAVCFLGNRSDIPELMQAMDCFVLPSLYEGIPMTIIEAQAAGLPCLISEGVPAECDITGLVERLSLQESPEIWAERILGMADKPRKDTADRIRAAGYDLEENGKWLQSYYLEQWERNA